MPWFHGAHTSTRSYHHRRTLAMHREARVCQQPEDICVAALAPARPTCRTTLASGEVCREARCGHHDVVCSARTAHTHTILGRQHMRTERYRDTAWCCSAVRANPGRARTPHDGACDASATSWRVRPTVPGCKASGKARTVALPRPGSSGGWPVWARRRLAKHWVPTPHGGCPAHHIM